MTINSRLIDYLSVPIEDIDVSEAKVKNLRNLFSDFNFKIIDNYYNFIYENIEINISSNGAVLISLVSALDFLENMSMLSKIMEKINAIISAKETIIRLSFHDLN